MVRPQTIVSDDEDSDFEYADQPPSTAPAKAPAKAPGKPKATSTKAAEPVATGRIRKPSQKQAAMNKENHEDLARANARLRKELKAFKNAGIVPQGVADNDDDDEFESEDGMEDDEPGIGASGRIRPLQDLPQPPEKPARLRRRVPGGKKVAKVRSLLSAPEPTPEQMQLDSQPTPPSSPRRLDTQDPEQEPIVATDDDMPTAPPTSSPSAAAAARRGKRPATSDAEAPPAKRSKDARQPRFRDGVPPTGKPKASQYDATDGAVILRACQTFSCKVLSVTAVPDDDKLAEMVKASWKDGCRVARERVALTHSVRKIIEARLPQVRGKVVDAFRSLVSVCFELERSKSPTVIEANKKIVEDLLREPMSFHYKDTETRTGFGENKIFVQARRLAHFRAAESLAIRYPSTFNPLPIPFLALEFAALEFVLRQWKTGTYVEKKFIEKDIRPLYATHLAKITAWTKINLDTTLKLRQKWYTRASATLEGEQPVVAVSVSLGAEEEAALRAQLESRTGDTDSEKENDDENDDEDAQ